MFPRLLRRISTSPFAQDFRGPPEPQRPRTIVSLPIHREAMQVTFSTQSARFMTKGKYLYVKERGSVLVEFAPRALEQKPEEKKVCTLAAEDFYHILHLQEDIQLSKRFKTHTAVLSFQRIAEDIRLSLELQQDVPVHRSIDLRSGEFFMVQQYLRYALPYTIGWFALGNAELATQHAD